MSKPSGAKGGLRAFPVAECETWDTQGRGLIAHQGEKIPIEGLIPGEKASVRLVRGAGGKFTEGFVEQMVMSSPLRVKPRCAHFGPCGACQLQHMSSEGQRQFKQKVAEQALSKFCKVSPILMMSEPWRYRNKAHITFGERGRNQIVSGLYQEGSHRLVPIESCLVQTSRADGVAATIRGLLPGFKILPYNEDTGRGLLRHVLVREGFATGELMVVLVLADGRMPSKRNFVSALLKAHPDITTILINVNSMRTSMVLGKYFECLHGPGFIRETTAGLTFEIAPSAFYQINPIQTEKLYREAVAVAELTGKERVIDAYCGVGTIGMLASKNAKTVIGVESNREAVEAAGRNLKLNGIDNVQLVASDAGQWMQRMAAKGEQFDVLMMDPPRAGADRAFLESVATLSPKRIVYVSCNVETQARDLDFLVNCGYSVKSIQPVDMFPQTTHVETIALLCRKVT